MRNQDESPFVDRRDFLRMLGGAAAAAMFAPGWAEGGDKE